MSVLAKTSSAAVGKDAEAAVTGLVRIFKVTYYLCVFCVFLFHAA